MSQNPSLTIDEYENTCEECGEPLGSFDPRIQGNDEGLPPLGRRIRRCVSCSVSSIFRLGGRGPRWAQEREYDPVEDDS